MQAGCSRFGWYWPTGHISHCSEPGLLKYPAAHSPQKAAPWSLKKPAAHCGHCLVPGLL